MSAVVAVAIHLASVLSPELAARTVKSCQAALGEDRCRLSDEPPTSDEYYATVTAVGSNADAAHIVLVRRDADHPIVERDLAFLPEDAPGDRWASVGVVIAALVTAAEGTAQKPPPPKPAAPPPPPARPPPRPPPAPRATHPMRVDVLVHLSHETATNFPKELGGSLRFSYLVPGSPVFFGAAAGYAARIGEQPFVQFPQAGIGGGVRWGAPDARWAAEFHLMGLTQYWIISASEPGRSEWKGVWRFGGSLGADLIWAASERWQLVGGVSTQVLTPRVTVDVGGQIAEQTPQAGYALAFGLRWRP
jgi:hypothetical protein